MNKTLLPLLFVGALSSAAAAQDSADPLWTDLAESRAFPSFQEQGGRVVEEWYTPRLRGSLSFFGRASFPGNTEVTSDGLWYSDFFDWAGGVSVEGDLLSFLTPHWAVGGYLSLNWDRFYGNRLNFFNGDFVDVDDMDLTTVIVGGKVLQRLSPYVYWEGRLGLGIVHYAKVEWSGVDGGTPFSNEELFKSINRGVFELGGRICVGDRHIQGDFGFGMRFMGGAARGADVTSLVDPDMLITFMLELGLSVRF
ncbi:MAG: hypothetical protein JO332_03990 [Planctomycetaceae bacterium]|nr:hypothetical protein [Planctomycetaceae bacterium]